MTRIDMLSALPATVIDADVAKSLPVHEDPAVGDTVVTHTRGRYRVARVTKVGPKRLTVEYTTQGAWDTAAKAAMASHVARIHANVENWRKLAASYRETAEIVERLGIEPTEDKPLNDGHWVPASSLPAEYVKTDRYARDTIIVYKPETHRQWADDRDAAIVTELAKLEEAAAFDALPLAERTAAYVHVTTKNIKREDALSLPA